MRRCENEMARPCRWQVDADHAAGATRSQRRLIAGRGRVAAAGWQCVQCVLQLIQEAASVIRKGACTVSRVSNSWPAHQHWHPLICVFEHPDVDAYPTSDAWQHSESFHVMLPGSHSKTVGAMMRNRDCCSIHKQQLTCSSLSMSLPSASTSTTLISCRMRVLSRSCSAQSCVNQSAVSAIWRLRGPACRRSMRN